jgi:hypothetical protein
MFLRNIKLRMIWIIPNVFCYLLLIGISIFIALNTESLLEIGRLGIWVLTLLVLLLVSIFGSYRIWTWIKDGKM